MTRINNSLLFKRNGAIDMRHVLFIIISIIVMFIDTHYRYLSTIRQAMTLTIAPVQFIVNYPNKLYTELKYDLKSYVNLQKENQHMRLRLLKYESKLQQFQSVQKENKRLRALLKSSPKADEDLTIASLLAVSMDPFQQILKLAKGRLQKVKRGQPVLDANGVLGQIMRADLTTSEVLLVTDARSAIPVVNSRNGIRSIAVGTNTVDFMKLLHISNTADIKPGDLFVTSGMGQRFPEGYPVGIVENVTQPPGESFAEISLIPSAKIDRVQFVLLVKSVQRKKRA